MTELKGVVSVLCELLCFMGIGDFHPETFRCAKFNKTTSEESLFRSMRHLIEMQHFLSGELVDADSRAKEVTLVSKMMLKMGYGKDRFYRWLENYSRCDHVDQPEAGGVGSRDLLLAFVWLLYQMKIFDKYSFYIRRCFVCLTTSLPSSATIGRIEQTIKHPRDWWKWMEEQNRSSRLESGTTADDSSCNKSLIQQALISRNKIAATARAIYSAESGFVKLSSKAHKATERTTSVSSGLPHHLSLNDVYLLRHPDLLRRCSYLLGKLTEHLEKLVMWTQQSQVFWLWMESIIDAEQLEINSGRTQHKHTAQKGQCSATSASDVEATLPDRRSPVWTWHLQWLKLPPKKQTVSTSENKKCSVKHKIEEATTKVASLETKLNVLQEQCRSNVDKVKSLFPELIFETSSIRLRKK